jgi:hypothetical protein
MGQLTEKTTARKDDVFEADDNDWRQDCNLTFNSKSNSKEPKGIFLKGKDGKLYHFDSYPWMVFLKPFELILKYKSPQ